MNGSITVSVPQPSEDGSMHNKDFVFYYEETSESNGLEVVIPVKKHEKKEFRRAIEEQLMYIPNVVFKSKKQDDFSYEEIDIAAKIMYRDNNIVISETTLLDYPHILLGAGRGLINYGAVDFQALELEPKRGAVGLILDINSVEVTPSREAVVWSPKTRAAVVSAYNEIVETATKLINIELDSADDYLEWAQKAGSIKSALVTNQAATGSVLQKLSGIIDASSINKIYYRKNGMNVLYVSDVKEILGGKILPRIYSYERYSKRVNREKIKSVNSLSGMTIYVTDNASDKYRDRYLYEHVENRKNFIVLKRLEDWEEDPMSKLVGTSKILVDYDSIVVPEDIMDSYLKDELDNGTVEDDESATVTVDSNRLAKLRKLEQKVLFHKLNGSDLSYSSREIEIGKIAETYSGKSVVYGSFTNRSLMNAVLGFLPYKALSAINQYNVNYYLRSSELFTDTWDIVLDKMNIIPVDAILISKDVEKHLQTKNNFKSISDFIIDSYSDGKIRFSNAVRFGTTLKLMHDIYSNFDISVNLIDKKLFSADITSKFFTEDFKIMLMMLAYFESATWYNHDMHPFFKYAALHQLGEGIVDTLTLDGYLSAMDDNIPEELCATIDEITSVDIVDINLIRKFEEYCKYFYKLKPILKGIRHHYDTDILETIYPLIQNDKSFPQEINYFR